MDDFHPIVAEWFKDKFKTPTLPQARGWPPLRQNKNVLIAAPTGSGKTMSAFLVAIDQLVRQAITGTLDDRLEVVYVSPLRALSNDIKINLEVPLAEITDLVQQRTGKNIKIQVGLRTGDSTATERSRLLKSHPHILVTTPESLYLLLTNARGRALLEPARYLIVDEIHALARDKRGSHLSLSLCRLQHLCQRQLIKVGLSATLKPLSLVGDFLCYREPYKIIDCSAVRNIELAVSIPESPLSAVCSHEQWSEVFHNLEQAITSHRSTLVFVNTRRMAERVTFHLAELLGEDAVTSHHGSLSKEARFNAEQRLKSGQLKAIVATASLELGIDVGFIDQVCQIGSPRSIATFLQRIGRSGHALGLTPKGLLFALTRDELLECYALIQAVQDGDMDTIEIPENPLDILAQQIVAAVAEEEWYANDLFKLVTNCWTFRNLERSLFDQILKLLNDGASATTRKGAFIHWDKINDRVKGRPHARLSALTSGGAIPEQNLYRVVTGDSGTFVGTLDEDFAIESSRGDIFLLGNTSWQVEAVRQGQVIVHDAGGAPPSIPFWLGEAPGRTYELSRKVSELRASIDALLDDVNFAEDPVNLETRGFSQRYYPLQKFLQEQCHADDWGIQQILNYCSSQKLAMEKLPTLQDIYFERFFDDTGGMQLVVHAPYGARINRAWGLAFRKRFCRSFDFELQAIADDNGIVLAVGPNQSFPLESMFNMLNSQNCRHLLIQALLDAPMFQIRWRWNVTRALAVLRFRGGKKVPPHLQRYQSDDLLTSVFPGQTQCFEHRTGDLEVPDHPYVLQTVHDCLTEAMDVTRFEELMLAKKEGQITFHGIDTREPSPFSYELINANPYAFLDDAPLEERRTRAVFTRSVLNPADFQQLGSLDLKAINKVCSEAWPLIRNPDELHDALCQWVAIPLQDILPQKSMLEKLIIHHRAFMFHHHGDTLAAASENLGSIRSLYNFTEELPHVPTLYREKKPWKDALKAFVRGQLECRGPTKANELAQTLGIDEAHINTTLLALESDGVILSGHFRSGPPAVKEWCERRLLARIHRLTIEGLREQIKPVALTQFIKFLYHHQHLDPATQLSGEDGTKQILLQLMGYEAPCSSWEQEILASRIDNYSPQFLDNLCFTGSFGWGRLAPPHKKADDREKINQLSRIMPISFFPRTQLSWLLRKERPDDYLHITELGRKIYDYLATGVTPFFEDLKAAIRQPAAAVEEALGELVSLGFVNADSFAALRPFISSDRKLKSSSSIRKRSRRRLIFETGFQKGGRWAMFPPPMPPIEESERIENWAWLLLERYGVVFKDLILREKLVPNWFDLVRTYRRMEMRGEIRGGRFVHGVSGEQFALHEAIDKLRSLRSITSSQQWIVLSACDPLNLEGIVNDHKKITRTPGNRLLFENGELIAYREAGATKILIETTPEKVEMIKRAIRLNGHFRQNDPFLKQFFNSLEKQKDKPSSSSKGNLTWSLIKGER